MSEQAVRVERSGPVTTVYLHRPARRNAVDGPTAVALAAAFRAFDTDPDAAVAVLHGEGGVFCSGADLTALGTERGNRAVPDGDAPMGVSRLRLTKPVIAAVSGYAVAGGLELALWCDLRVADETAVFGVFCRRWGVPLIDGGTVRLPRLIGTSRAMDMILTGRAVDARRMAVPGTAARFPVPGQNVVIRRGVAAHDSSSFWKDSRSGHFPAWLESLFKSFSSWILRSAGRRARAAVPNRPTRKSRIAVCIVLRVFSAISSLSTGDSIMALRPPRAWNNLGSL